MAVRRIRVVPDPVLRADCPRVVRFDGELKRLVRDLIDTMHAAPGVGLAAPQVGVEAQVAVVDLSVGEDPDALLVLVNPEVTAGEETWIETEGCLSIPEFTEKVERPFRIRLEAQDLEGRPFEIEAEEWQARAICHEVDHLRGVLFIDHLKGLKRERARRHLKRLAREQEVPA